MLTDVAEVHVAPTLLEDEQVVENLLVEEVKEQKKPCTKEEVSFVNASRKPTKGDEIKLVGTLRLPGGASKTNKVPVVLLIGGTGGIWRDFLDKEKSVKSDLVDDLSYDDLLKFKEDLDFFKINDTALEIKIKVKMRAKSEKNA